VLEVSHVVHTMTVSNSMFRLQSSTASPLAREITLCLHGQVSRLPIVDARYPPLNKQKGARLTTACKYCNTSGNSGQKNYNAFVNLKINQQIKTTLCIFTRSCNIVLSLFVGTKQWSVSRPNKMREADAAREKNFESAFLDTRVWLRPSC